MIHVNSFNCSVRQFWLDAKPVSFFSASSLSPCCCFHFFPWRKNQQAFWDLHTRFAFPPDVYDHGKNVAKLRVFWVGVLFLIILCITATPVYVRYSAAKLCFTKKINNWKPILTKSVSLKSLISWWKKIIQLVRGAVSLIKTVYI